MSGSQRKPGTTDFNPTERVGETGDYFRQLFARSLRLNLDEEFRIPSGTDTTGGGDGLAAATRQPGPGEADRRMPGGLAPADGSSPMKADVDEEAGEESV